VMATCWLCNKKYGVAIVFASTVCWGYWKPRNLLCFQGAVWTGMRGLWDLVLPMLRSWRILIPVAMMDS
jgi:hypothetical protein